MQKYKDLLQKHEVKATYQRIKVLEYLEKHRTHPTVDEIYEALVQDNPSFSKTTVYNSIDILYQHGLISTLTITGKEVRCDFDGGDHHHFLCYRCGKIYDLEHLKCCFKKGDEIEGHQLEEVHRYFKGTCKKCRQAKTS